MFSQKVFAAGNVSEGEAIARRQNPDVIVLDLGLPDGDGHRIARRIRSNAETADTPIVFLTARGGQDDVARAEAIGAAAYLVKPCQAKEVAVAITHALRGRSRLGSL